MEEENVETQDPSGKTPKPMDGMTVVALNLLALAAYTLAFKFVSGGFIADAFCLVIHVCFCIIKAISDKSWLWLLGGLLVLVIGFSTCAMTIGAM